MRYSIAVQGEIVQDFRDEPGECLMAAAFYLTYRIRRLQRPIAFLLVTGIALALSTATVAWRQHCPVDVAMAIILDPKCELRVVAAVLTCLIAWDSAMRDLELRKPALLAIALGLMAALPYIAATQIRQHALVDALAFQSVFVGILVITSMKRIRAAIIKVMTHRRPLRLA